MTDGIVKEVHLTEERMYYIPATVILEVAKDRVERDKLKCVPNKSLMGMRGPSIEEVVLEKTHVRYEPFWFVDVSFKTQFDRQTSYSFTPKDGEVVAATIFEQRIGLNEATESKLFQIDAVEHCKRFNPVQFFYDDVLSQPNPALKEYLSYKKVPIENSEKFVKENPNVVRPQRKSTYILKLAFNEAHSLPDDANIIHDEILELNLIDLIFRPVYRFTYFYKPIRKRLFSGRIPDSWEFDYDPVRELNLCEGETRPLSEIIKDVSSSDVVFDIAFETLNLFVPGSMIAARIIQEKRKKSD